MLISFLPAPVGGPLASHRPSRPPANPGAGQGALPPSRPPPEPLGLAGSPGCDVAATKPSLAYVLRSLHPPRALAGYGELRTSPAPTAPKAPYPLDPAGPQPARIEGTGTTTLPC